jgi:hypothetical protein
MNPTRVLIVESESRETDASVGRSHHTCRDVLVDNLNFLASLMALWACAYICVFRRTERTKDKLLQQSSKLVEIQYEDFRAILQFTSNNLTTPATVL